MRIAALCIWLSAALVVVTTLISLRPMLRSIREGVALGQIFEHVIPEAFLAGILVLAAVKLLDGRSWSRWYFAVVYLFIAFLTLAPMMDSAVPQNPRTPLQLTVDITFALLVTAALVLQFVRPSRKWFAALK